MGVGREGTRVPAVSRSGPVDAMRKPVGRRELGRRPEVKFQKLVRLMVEAALEFASVEYAGGRGKQCVE